MITYGNKVRLAQRDRGRLKLLCGVEPPDVATISELNAFIDAEICRLPKATAEDRLAIYLLTQLKA